MLNIACVSYCSNTIISYCGFFKIVKTFELIVPTPLFAFLIELVCNNKIGFSYVPL